MRRRLLFLTAVLISLLAVVGCEASEEGESPAEESGQGRPTAEGRHPIEVRHPMEGARLSSSTDATVLHLDFATLEEELPVGLAPLAQFPEDAAVGFVGLLADDTAQVLGEIRDALLLPAGLGPEPGDGRGQGGGDEAEPVVALLDGSYGMVRTFTPDGTPGVTIGGIGEGPGELTMPVALAHGEGTVMILDAAMKIEAYRWGGAEWEPSSRIPLPMDAQDLCPLAEGLAVMGMRTGEDGRLGSSGDARAVHLLSHDDQKILASLSAPYRYDGIIALWYMMRGKLACDAGRGMVWVAYESLGEVHALDVDGDLLWIARLADISVPNMVELDGGAAMGGRHQEGVPVEIISGINLLDDDLLAVQVMSALFQQEEEGTRPTRTVSYRTYLIDAKTGEGMGGFRAEHQVIGGGGGRAILYREDPYPQFAVVDLRGSSSR